MSEAISLYHNRAPRYIFRADDLSLMRFAEMGTRGVARSAIVRDLSETGLAIVVDGPPEAENLPHEGEMLKIEFTVPGRKQIACFSTIVRIDALDEWDPQFGSRQKTMIALQFRNLPSAHLRALRRGLENRVSNEPEFDWQKTRIASGFQFASLATAMGAALVTMILPIDSWLAPVRDLIRHSLLP